MAALHNVHASGGGDCPELFFGGILSAAKAARQKSLLYAFTDASAKDVGIASLAAAQVQAKKISAALVLSGSCSDGRRSVDEIAAFAQQVGARVIDTEKSSEAITRILDLEVATLRTDTALLAHVQLAAAYTPSAALCVSSSLCYCANVTVAVSPLASNFVFSITYPGSGTIDETVVSPPNISAALNVRCGVNMTIMQHVIFFLYYFWI